MGSEWLWGCLICSWGHKWFLWLMYWYLRCSKDILEVCNFYVINLESHCISSLKYQNFTLFFSHCLMSSNVSLKLSKSYNAKLSIRLHLLPYSISHTLKRRGKTSVGWPLMTNKRELSLRKLASKSSKQCNKNLEPNRQKDQLIDCTAEITSFQRPRLQEMQSWDH